MLDISITPVYFSLVLLCCWHQVDAQQFYIGADQSYVNEMEDCGEQYFENGQEKDVHQIFKDYGCTMVRFRLWHTPSWYDDLNHGARYSDLPDVAKGIRRVKDLDMSVLLNFHLSDNWADPSKQVVPAAWLPVVDQTMTLADSLYNYVFHTLDHLATEDLLPELVQLGNETNRGILLSPEQNQEWTLDWERNAILFNAAIRAVNDVNVKHNTTVQKVLHFAAPDEVEWWINGAYENGITDFDIIGMSYYWAWHQPVTIEETGETIFRLRKDYPDKEVMIVETGYPWTLDNFDNAPNIINTIQPGYEPVSPKQQLQWLIDLTQEAMDQGAMGVLYWEPSWVSTTCWNQWDQGSHQDHATFFDQNNNLLLPGGIQFMDYNYGETTRIDRSSADLAKLIQVASYTLQVKWDGQVLTDYQFELTDTTGRIIHTASLNGVNPKIELPNTLLGVYIGVLSSQNEIIARQKFRLP